MYSGGMEQADAVILDFHAEATSEKQALAWYLDGRVAAVVGTHTHVQTADEQIFPGGTAFLCDAGFTGPHESCLGRDIQPIIERFIRLAHRPQLAAFPHQNLYRSLEIFPGFVRPRREPQTPWLPIPVLADRWQKVQKAVDRPPVGPGPAMTGYSTRTRRCFRASILFRP